MHDSFDSPFLWELLLLVRVIVVAFHFFVVYIGIWLKFNNCYNNTILSTVLLLTKSTHCYLFSPQLIRSMFLSKNIVCGIYFCIVIVLGILGNSFVLFATIVRRAIKLDKMCVWIIQNLAVVDISNVLFIILPTAASLFAEEEWILGQFTCQLTFAFKYSFVTGNIFLINFLSLNKLLRCLFPLRNLVTTRRQRLTVTIVTAVLMATGPIRKIYVIFIAKSALVRYSAKHTSCIGYQVVNGVEQYLHPKFEMILSYFLIVAPCVSLLVINTSLVILAVRSTNSKVNRKNVLIVFLVTLIFIVTFLPFFSIHLIYSLRFLAASYRMRVVTMVALVSTFSNPFIYLATNDVFRKFTKSTLRWLFCQSLSKTWTSARGKIHTAISKMQSNRSLGSSVQNRRKEQREEKKADRTIEKDWLCETGIKTEHVHLNYLKVRWIIRKTGGWGVGGFEGPSNGPDGIYGYS